jgi:DNA-binding MarR family transcriptional regulator
MKTSRGLGRLCAALKLLHRNSDNMTIGAAISFCTVAEYEGKSLREYGDMLELPQSTMSRHLLDLGEMDRRRRPGLMLIEQKPDIMDRRKNVYTLTLKGRRLIEELIKAVGG